MATVKDLEGLKLLVFDVPSDAFPQVRPMVDKITRQQLIRDNRRYVSFGAKRYELKLDLVKPKRQGPRTVMIVQPNLPGPWAWAESGTKPHRIAPRRAQALSAGGNYERPVRYDGGQLGIEHPGSRGKQSLTKTLAKVTPELEEIYWDETLRQIGRVG